MNHPTLPGACHAELLKLRGTLAGFMSLLAPLLVVGLFSTQMLLVQTPERLDPSSNEAWIALFQGVLGLWTFLMLPLYITLQSALLAGMEHANNQWKYLLALPVPRHYHYLAKAFAMLLLLTVASAVLFLATLAAGLILQQLKPALGIGGTPAWGFLACHIAAAVAAAGLMAVIQLWTALRAKSFTVAVGVGMGATVGGFLIGQSPRFGPWYPWTMPLHTTTQGGAHMALLAGAGILGAVLAGGVLGILLTRHTPV